MLIKKPFFFIRHGQTDWNFQEIRMGQQDIPLNDTGRQQAIEAKKIITQYPIAHVCYSPLKRAAETAHIIAADISCSQSSIDNLKEWHFGHLEGKSKKNSGVESIYELENLTSFCPPGGESWETFFTRVIAGISEALNNPGPVLIVAHGGVFAALSHYMNYKREVIDNCSLFYIEYVNESWVIKNLCK